MKAKLQELTKLIESKGFNVKEVPFLGLFQIEEKDIWSGVMFAECLKTDVFNCFTKGRIYKMRDGKTINDGFSFTDNQGENNGRSEKNKDHFKPSTHEAYGKQLIQEAKEKFGEIKEGDRFRRDFGCIKQIGTIGEYDVPLTFSYDEKDDSLEFSGTMIYDKGKWAERIKEVTVDYFINPLPNTVVFAVRCDPNLVSENKAKDIKSLISKALNEK